MEEKGLPLTVGEKRNLRGTEKDENGNEKKVDCDHDLSGSDDVDSLWHNITNKFTFTPIGTFQSTVTNQ